MYVHLKVPPFKVVIAKPRDIGSLNPFCFRKYSIPSYFMIRLVQLYFIT